MTDNQREVLPPLTIGQLEYLVEIHNHGTWAAAAERMGVSTSALSQGISQLENRIGVRIFTKAGRGRALTDEGELVLAYAQRVVAETRDLARWARGVSAGLGGTLRVGMIDLAAVTLFGEVLQSFRVARPELDFHLDVAPSAALLEKVRMGNLNFAVVVEPPLNTGDLAFWPLLRDSLAVYGPHGAGPTPTENWGPWVTFPAGSHTRELVAKRLAQMGASFQVVAESNQPAVLREMVMLGMGWTVLPVLQAEIAPNPLVRIGSHPILNRQLVVAQRHNQVQNVAANELIAQLQQSAAD